MKNSSFVPIIGLEIHIELKTSSKMFCGCSADYFGKEPNTLTCPVCLGLPGALPVPNRKAVEWTIMLGMALNCEIAHESKFDRKNYFYPDLTKGYQISQYDQPIATKGGLKFQIQKPKSKIQNKFQIPSLKQIRIRRVHLEEDTGKLLHETVDGQGVTLVDFNRSGVCLVEIVTEPDLRSSGEADLFLKKLHQIVRYLGISDAEMEKGSFRIEPNVSILTNSTSGDPPRETPDVQLPDYKVEIKNINSFRFARQAVEYEIRRQTELLKGGITPVQETRGWDERRQVTVSQRLKEEADDYRYFPEPDIPPLQFSILLLSRLRKQIPELPDVKAQRFISNYQLSEYNATLLAAEQDLANWFEEAVRAYVILIANKQQTTNSRHQARKVKLAQTVANWILGDLLSLLKKENKSVNELKIFPSYLVELLYLLDEQKISLSVAKQVFTESFNSGKKPAKIIEEKNLSKITDSTELSKIIATVIGLNSKAVKDLRKGKNEVIGFLVGQVMRETKGRADAKEVMKLIKDQLKLQDSNRSIVNRKS